MNILRIILFVVAATAFASSSSARSVSGAYLNRGRDFVELLQITAKADGSLEGTLTHATLKNDGSLSQENSPIEGATDGRSITVVLKRGSALSMSGTFDDGVIALTLPDGVARYVESDPMAYQAAVQQMRVRGAAIQLQRHIDEENKAVAALNKRLTDYAAMVQAPRNEELRKNFHATHAGALVKARRALEIEQRYPRNSVQASQVSVDISQINVNLQAYDNQWRAVPEQGRSHLKDLDMAIASSLCKHPDAPLSNCSAQPAAIQLYQTAKPIVEERIAEIESTIRADQATMAAIVQQAEDYTR